jgi:ABC-type nitrate/sulfonate/bicarbonate transport system substrate-binding protein
LRVGKSSATGFTFFPLDVGIDQHIFEKNGLTLELADLGGSAKLHQALIADGIDIGLGAGTDISFLVKGAPEMAVGAVALSPALFGLVALDDSPIKKPSDIKGRRIGISTASSLTEWLVLQLQKKEGLQPGDVTRIAVGSDTTPQLAAMQTKQIDAVMTAAALGLNLAQQGRGRLIIPASQIAGQFVMNVLYATNNILAKDPDDVRRFVKAWYEAVAYMNGHKAETVRVAQAITHFSAEVQDQQYDQVMPSLSTDGRFPPAAVKAVQESFVDLAILEKEPDMTKYLTEKYLPAK